METSIKKTPLHSYHLAQGANMADFGGYEMPLWYSSAKNEHLAVLQSAGIFDTSHMAAVLIEGTAAREMLQHCFTNNLDACVGPSKKPLTPGRCVYGAYLNEKGEVIDDSIIKQLSKTSYLAVVNAGMGETIAMHFNGKINGRDIVVKDLTDKLGKVDVQGPMAAKIMGQVLAAPMETFEKMCYFTFKGYFDPASPLAEAVRLVDGTPILLSRTGYTGEFGFEIFVAAEKVEKVWEMIMKSGSEYGLTACGLAARDSLRGGAVLPLSHQDIGHWPFINHPWPFALPFATDQKSFSKDFIGAQALLDNTNKEFTYAFIGKDLRKISTDDAAVLDGDGNAIGKVLTCVTDMGIGYKDDKLFSIASPDRTDDFKPKGLSCGFIKVNTELADGAEVVLKDSRRSLKVHLTQDIRPDRTARKPMQEMI